MEIIKEIDKKIVERMPKDIYRHLGQYLNLSQNVFDEVLYGDWDSYHVVVGHKSRYRTRKYWISVCVCRPSGRRLSLRERRDFLRQYDWADTIRLDRRRVVLMLKTSPQRTDEACLFLERALKTFTQYLHEREFVNCCNACGAPECSPCSVEGICMQLCDVCFVTMRKKGVEGIKKLRINRERLISGLLWAAAGGAAGILLQILLSGLNHLSLLLGPLTMLLVLKGYQHHARRMTLHGLFFSTVIGMGSVCIGHYCSVVMLVARAFETDPLSALRWMPQLMAANVISYPAYGYSLLMQLGMMMFVLAACVKDITDADELCGAAYHLRQSNRSLEAYYDGKKKGIHYGIPEHIRNDLDEDGYGMSTEEIDWRFYY